MMKEFILFNLAGLALLMAAYTGLAATGNVYTDPACTHKATIAQAWGLR